MSEVADYSVGEPPPIHTNERSVHDLVCEDLAYAYPENMTIQLVIKDMLDRKAFGLGKYKTILQVSNGRNPIRDGYAELLDALVYAKQAIERGTVVGHGIMYKELVDLAKHWRSLIFLEDAMLAQADRENQRKAALKKRSKEIRG